MLLQMPFVCYPYSPPFQTMSGFRSGSAAVSYFQFKTTESHCQFVISALSASDTAQALQLPVHNTGKRRRYFKLSDNSKNNKQNIYNCMQLLVKNVKIKIKW